MDIIFEKTKKTGIIKLNRPEALNALNYDMAKNFSYQLNEWEKNDSIEQILLLGEGKHFCAGGDVKSLSLGGKNSNLKRVVSLGYQPLANNLLNKKNDKCELYPLELNYSPDCHNCQLSVSVDPKKMLLVGLDHYLI